MTEELLFIGFRCFMSKSEKMCYILSFLTPPRHSQDKSSCFTSQIDIFTEESKYKAFIDNNSVLDFVKLNYEIIGDKVRYFV